MHYLYIYNTYICIYGYICIILYLTYYAPWFWPIVRHRSSPASYPWFCWYAEYMVCSRSWPATYPLVWSVCKCIERTQNCTQSNFAKIKCCPNAFRKLLFLRSDLRFCAMASKLDDNIIPCLIYKCDDVFLSIWIRGAISYIYIYF